MVASVGGIIMTLFTSGAYPEWAFWTQSGEAIFMIAWWNINFRPLSWYCTFKAYK